MPEPTFPSLRRRVAPRLGLMAAFAVLCGLPYGRWVEHPSLFHDDLMRAESLRNSTLGQALFRPFNEHMAPLFETVSYLAWLGAGRRIEGLPLTFLIASFASFGATTAILAALIRRETRSTSATMIAVALFVLSSVSSETVLWYSASSFQWAAAGTLAAWYCAAAAADPTSIRPRWRWLIASAAACLAAPAFSAIGMLAAPLAGLRLLAGGDRRGLSIRAIAGAAVPATGLALYLLICSAFRYRDVLGDSLSKNLDLGAAIWATVKAPAWVLLPALVGQPDWTLTMPGGIAAGLTILGLAGSLVVAIRSRFRAPILVGSAMIVGGYLMTYAARAHSGDDWIMKISRYHLFPQIGLVCLIAGLIGGLGKRLDAGPTRGWLAATLVAALLASMQYRGMRLAAEGPYRTPDQARVFAAAARLEAVAKEASISFDQLMRAIDPAHPRWAPHPWPFHPINFLMPKPTGDGRRVADADVRAVVIAGLTPEERGVIFGGMVTDRHRRPTADLATTTPPVPARLVATYHVGRLGEDRFQVGDSPAYLEYQVDPAADEALAISIPELKSEWPVEIWWAGSSEDWSADRSVRWQPESAPLPGGWAVPLSAFPHWQKGSPRRLRIVAGGPGPMVADPPRFLR